MPRTYLQIKIRNPQNPRKNFKRKFLVDSGSEYSVIDSEIIEKLDLEQADTEKHILPNGEEIELKTFEAIIRHKNKEIQTEIVAGGENVFVLGTDTLKKLGYSFDSIRRKLFRDKRLH